MKAFKWFFLILAVVVVAACGDSSEEELLGNWKKQGDFDGPPRGYAATFVIGNKGYVCCGYNGNKLRRNDVYEFDNTDISQPRWYRKADFPGKPRQQAVGFSVNGKGYIGTGFDGDETVMRDFWEFDPTNNSWRQVATLPGGANGAYARRSAVAFTLKVGDKEYGYIDTGYTEGEDKLSLKDFWKFDPSVGDSGVWTQIPSYNGSKRYGAVAFVINNKAYICAGQQSSSSAVDMWEFEPETETWAEKRKTYDSNTDEDYDDDYGDISRAGAVAFVMNVEGEPRGHLAVGAGSKASVWEYNPLTDLWVQRTSYVNNNRRSPREGAVAFSFPEYNQAFVGLGMTGITPLETVWDFHPLEEDNTYDDD